MAYSPIPPAPPLYSHVQHNLPAQEPRYLRECKSIIRLSQREHAKVVATPVAKEVAKRTLTNYSNNENLEDSLKKSIRKILRTGPKNLKVIEADEVGYSGDKVYRVCDSETSQSLAIIKVFKENSKNFFPEIFSLNYLQTQNIPSFSSPQIKGFGKCLLQEENCFFLIESVAPGCSLLHLYRESLLIIDLERGIRECGRALAKLHQYAPGKSQSLPDYLEKITRQYLVQAVAKLKTYPQEKIDPEKLQELFEMTIAELKSEAFSTGVVHGDTKLINVFFEPQTNTVTWIDPPKLSESIDLSDHSIGIPAKDFHSFIVDIEHQQIMFFLDDRQQVCSKKLLSDAEILKLKELFSAGYQEAGGQIPTQKQLAFFSLASHLYFIANDSTKDVNRNIPEPSKSSRIYRMNRIFKDLESRL